MCQEESPKQTVLPQQKSERVTPSLLPGKESSSIEARNPKESRFDFQFNGAAKTLFPVTDQPVEVVSTKSKEAVEEKKSVISPPLENSLIPLDEPSSECVSTLWKTKDLTCRFPGCNTKILDERLYWGKDRKFCCTEHRAKMNLLFLRLKRLFKITECPFVESILAYLRLVSGGVPP